MYLLLLTSSWIRSGLPVQARVHGLLRAWWKPGLEADDALVEMELVCIGEHASV